MELKVKVSERVVAPAVFVQFLICRVELKEAKMNLKQGIGRLKFLICRVELKASAVRIFILPGACS